MASRYYSSWKIFHLLTLKAGQGNITTRITLLFHHRRSYLYSIWQAHSYLSPPALTDRAVNYYIRNGKAFLDRLESFRQQTERSYNRVGCVCNINKHVVSPPPHSGAKRKMSVLQDLHLLSVQ